MTDGFDVPRPPDPPHPLRPEDVKSGFRAGDLFKGLLVAGAIGAGGAVAAGVGGALLGEASGEKYASLVGMFLGAGAGFFLAVLTTLVVAIRRKASIGFRVGVAVVLGLQGLLLSACFLGI